MARGAPFLLVCGVLPVYLLLPPSLGGTPTGDEVLVETHSAPPEIQYTIRAGDCTVSWQVYTSAANRGVIRSRPACGLPLGEQAPLIAKVLHRVLQGRSDPAEFRTLSWGRLYPDGARDATMAARLALAAKRSPDWDARRGKPRSGDINGFVRGLANEASIYEELRQVFGAVGLNLRLAAVEKVLVMRAGDLTFFDRLREAGAQPGDRLPFDCQAWFSVTRQSGAKAQGGGHK